MKQQIELKTWNRKKAFVTGLTTLGVLGLGYFTFPHWGKINVWTRAKETSRITETYEDSVGVLGDRIDSLGSKLGVAEKTIDDTVEVMSASFGKKIDEQKLKEEKLKSRYKRELDEARRSSLDNLLAKYPNFNPDLTYGSDDGFLGSVVNEGANDIEGYFALKLRLETILPDEESLIGKVLSGESSLMVMGMEEASKYDPSVFEEGVYALETDSNGEVREGTLADYLENYSVE